MKASLYSSFPCKLSPVSWLAVLFALCLAIMLPASAAVHPGLPGVDILPSGRFHIDGLRFTAIHFDSTWAGTWQDTLKITPSYPKIEDTRGWQGAGTLALKNESLGSLALRQQLVPRPSSDGAPPAITVHYEAGPFAAPVATAQLCLSIEIPVEIGLGKTVRLNDRDIVLPSTLNTDGNLIHTRDINRIALPARTGPIEITGQNLTVSLHDMRRYGAQNYTLRIAFSPPPSDGRLTKAELTFDITRYSIIAPPAPVIAAPGPDWAPYNHRLDIAADSVFDRSHLIDAPAGKYGHITITPSGHFEFTNRPGNRVRFYGINLSFEANFPTREQADDLADRILRSGYNVVRLHHYDRELLRKGAASSHDFDPAQLERFDYLFAALKRRGLYINIDLYSMRGFPASEVPEYGRNFDMEIKYLVPVSNAAFETWSIFAQKILTHRNPHTGLTWGEDPAIIGICGLNEDSFFDRMQRPPQILALYEKAFASWLARRPADTTETESRDALFNRFLLEIKIASDARMFNFLRGLGVRAPLTGDNDKATEIQTMVREKLDVVDFHDYWNHPHYPVNPWNLPIAISHQSSITGNMHLPRNMMPVRIFGKPFIVTEFNYLWPNAARSEGSLLMAGYSGLQDWDALYHFDYATSPSSEASTAYPAKASRVFSLVTDPVRLLADRAAAFLFLHGGIRPAPGAIAWLADDNDATTTIFDAPRGASGKFPENYSWLGLTTRIGSLPASAVSKNPNRVENSGIQGLVVREKGASPASVGPIPVFQTGTDLEERLVSAHLLTVRDNKKIHRGETGQMTINRDTGTATLATDRAECFTLPAGHTLTGNHATVTVPFGDAFASIYVLSTDGAPLVDSSRILILHLTDSIPIGTRFDNDSRSRIEAFGQGPHLVRRGTATISLNLKNRTDASTVWQAWSVDASGRRTHAVPLKNGTDGELTLQTATVAGEDVTLAWELVRQSR